MGNFFSQLRDQIGQLWQGLGAWQRGALVATLVMVPVALAWLVFSLRPQYEMLHSNLEPSDSAEVERHLTNSNISYRIDRNDNSLWVAPNDKARAWALLAREGLPRRTTEGYGIFDRQRLGATEFEQRVSFVRALEQEIQRDIEAQSNIRAAQVRLVIPSPSVFTERVKDPTATVTITPIARALTEDEVQGIVQGVANSVEGLKTESVIVRDQTGRVISRRYDNVTLAAGEQRAYREMAEQTREDKIIDMLTQAYGNKVDGEAITAVASARVTAEFDHDTIEMETTTYAPETIVSKEHIESESSEGVPMPAAGIPGVTSNILGAGNVQGESTYTRESSTTEYQAGMTLERRKQSPKLLGLSTAVLVNSEVLTAEPGTPEYIAEQNQIKNIIAAAVLYNATNPDGVIFEPQIEFIAFSSKPPGTGIPVNTVPVIVPWYRNPIWILAILLGVLVLELAALLLKPRFGRQVEEADDAGRLPSADQEELRELLDQQRSALDEEERERRRRRRQALVDLADANPEEIERVLRHWSEAQR
ncbi:MAG: flagellar basal-body MS-ring/collar protein FliF [Candidatus Poribacteria bacterium]|nr:flagellar basal-body MS-ring/collar protein FliF [Candidatus Poribacteria bacterium]